MPYKVYAYSNSDTTRDLLPYIKNFIKSADESGGFSPRLKEHHGVVSESFYLEFETEEDFIVFKLKFS